MGEFKKKAGPYISDEAARTASRLDTLLLRAKIVRSPKTDRHVIRLDLLKELIERGLLLVSSIGSDVLLGDEIAAVETMISQHDPLADRELMARAMMSYQSTPRGDVFPELPENDHTGQRIGGPIEVDDGPDVPY